MKRTTLFLTNLMLLVLLPAVLLAQLGPKDGLSLPAVDLDRTQVGQPAPDFTLESADGRTLSLSDFQGKAVVLVFYRGYWCSWCQKQMIALHDLLPEDRKKDTVIVAVSADPLDKIGDIIPKVKEATKKDFEITLLSDPDHKVIDRYGLLNEEMVKKGRPVPHPTTLIVDSEGVIRWKETNTDHRVRPANEVILQELSKLR